MKFLKKGIATLSLVAALAVTTPAPKAQAGIILLPAGVGLILLIIGAAQNNTGLVILDADNPLGLDSIGQVLKNKYPQIEDQETLADLSFLIKEKLEVALPTNGRLEVKVSQQELLDTLEASGLAYTHPELVEKMITDFQ